MKLDVQTLDAQEAGGSIDLDDAVFGIKEIRPDILQRMVKYQLAKRRAGTHKTQIARRSRRARTPSSTSKRARARRATAPPTRRSSVAAAWRTVVCRATTATS